MLATKNWQEARICSLICVHLHERTPLDGFLQHQKSVDAIFC
jgi:hypothetical protein